MKHISDSERALIETTVNGRARSFLIEPRISLADALRYELGLTGTKVGCEHGVCGACTVLLDGEPVRACLMLGVQAAGRQIETIEGHAKGQALNPLQASFQRHHALQCGFCTAGMLNSAIGLLRRNPSPSRAEAREAMAGNLCRCTGYETIIDAICDDAVATYAKEQWHE